MFSNYLDHHAGSTTIDCPMNWFDWRKTSVKWWKNNGRKFVIIMITPNISKNMRPTISNVSNIFYLILRFSLIRGRGRGLLWTVWIHSTWLYAFKYFELSLPLKEFKAPNWFGRKILCLAYWNCIELPSRFRALSGEYVLDRSILRLWYSDEASPNIFRHWDSWRVVSIVLFQPIGLTLKDE